jgi:cyclophilin family peptidyl-prolyl cis-trans isomerase
MTKRWIGFAVSLSLLGGASAWAGQLNVPGYGPIQLSSERIVLQTQYGDLVLALFPQVAPKTTAQVLKLARAGLYDSTHFYRLEKGFVLQTSNVQDRTLPLSPAQAQLIHKIPGEFSRVPHLRGMLSMARWDDPNSAESSFSILLGSAPHLNGKYTVFGALVGGFDVLREIEKLEVNGTSPKERLEIESARVVDESAIPGLELRKARAGPHPAAAVSPKQDGPVMLAILGLIVLIGVTIFAFSKKLAARHLASLALIIVLLAGFALLLLLVPIGQADRRVAAAIFIGLIGLFRMMNQFETPA